MPLPAAPERVTVKVTASPCAALARILRPDTVRPQGAPMGPLKDVAGKPKKDTWLQLPAHRTLNRQTKGDRHPTDRLRPAKPLERERVLLQCVSLFVSAPKVWCRCGMVAVR